MKGIEKARKAVGHVSCPQDREDEMYRLGMLAAADIAESMKFKGGLDRNNSILDPSAIDIAKEIREAAK